MYQPENWKFEKFRDIKNLKDLDWYDKNVSLITEDNWRPLEKQDFVLYVYNEEGSRASFGQNIRYWREKHGKDPSIMFASNFKKIGGGRGKTYEYDISDAKFDSKDRLVIDTPRMRHDGYSFTDDVAGRKGFYLIENMPIFLQFINYSQIPQTK
jgi:hypothetical protein